MVISAPVDVNILFGPINPNLGWVVSSSVGSANISGLLISSLREPYFGLLLAQSLQSCCFLRQETLAHSASLLRCMKWVPSTYCWG